LEVEQAPHRLRVEHPVRVDHVGQHHIDPMVGLQHQFAVRHRDRIDVDVDHPAFRNHPLGDLMHVAHGGNARPEVQKLTDSLFGTEPNRSAEERPVLLRRPLRLRYHLDQPVGQLPIRRKVARAAKEIVIDPREIRLVDVDARHQPVRQFVRHAIA
jgi:hypothetical protein